MSLLKKVEQDPCDWRDEPDRRSYEPGIAYHLFVSAIALLLIGVTAFAILR